jgi:hypothetical protein
VEQLPAPDTSALLVDATMLVQPVAIVPKSIAFAQTSEG